MTQLLRTAFFCWLLATAWLPAHAGRDIYGVGDGHSGALIPASANLVINTYVQVTAPVAAGDVSLTVSSATGFAAGDLIMIWQATGLTPVPATGTAGPVDLTGSPVGRWELVRLTGASGTTLSFSAPMLFAYNANVTQAVRVPEYTTVTINAGRSLSAQAWNGSTGGILAFLATSTVSNNGIPGLTVNGKGFRGGTPVVDNTGSTGASGLDQPGPVGALKGEGIAFTRYGTGNTGWGRVANAAGGGVAYLAGGGGGGNGGNGGQGGYTADGGRPVGGQGGAALSRPDLRRLLLGGGGGAAHNDTNTAGIGGAGGGIIFVRCANLAGSGSMQANGTAAGPTTGTDAASGGGAGGTLYLRVVGAAASGALAAVGGNGGSANNGFDVGPGGSGGGGFILFQKGSGTAAPTAVATNPGAAGVQGDSGTPNYGAQQGTSGVVSTFTGAFPLLAAPVVSTPANGSSTSSLRPVMSGTLAAPLPAGTTVVLVLDGTDYTTVTPDAAGNFTYTPTGNLAAGTHTLKARAENATNYVASVDGNTNTFTIDVTPPAAPVLSTPANGSSVNTATPTYTGTAEANSTVTVYVDGSSVGTTTATAAGMFSTAQPSALSPGTHTVYATATDAAGNVSPIGNTNTFTVDTTAPTVAITSGTSSPTTTSPIAVTVTFSESVVGFTAADVAVGNGSLAGFGGSGTTYTFNVTPTAPGPVTVDVAANQAQDAAGNGNAAAPQFSINYLGTMPTISSVAPAAGGLGQPITLSGYNLGSPTALTINGANALAGIVSNTGTSLVVRVPATAAPSGVVSISTATGTTTAPFTVMAPPGNALAFDGVDDHLALPLSTPVPVGNSQYTIEAWIKPNQMGVYGIIGWGTYGATNQVNALRLSPNGIINYWWGADLVVTTPNLSGRWHHVAATFNGTTRTIYLDGAAVGSDTPGGHTVPDARNLRIGSTNNPSSGANYEYFNGSIDEVRVYSVALTPTQLRADMTSPTAAVPASLVLYYNMDQGTPATASTGNNTGLTTLYDLSANATPATLTNFALASGNTASNYVPSYALVVPVLTTSTARTATGFTVNWTAPAYGTATSYLLDVSTTPDFAAPIAGSPFATTATSYVLTGLNPTGAYYYRVRPLNSALAQPDQGTYSNTVSQTTPLPVELTAFTATAEGPAAVHLAWATASEKNSQQFEVERSADGTTFGRIGTVAAAGTSSNAPRRYGFVDGQLPIYASIPLLYYRLKLVDADGTFSFSPVRTVALNNPTAAVGLALYPNPAHAGTTTLLGAAPGAVVTVLDALGRQVASAAADAAGTAVLKLPAGLPAGVYVVRSGTRAVRMGVE